MKSKTSFFNPTVLRKDILRYSPLWVLYTLGLLLFLFGISEGSRPMIGRDTINFLKAMAWINLFYGGACGVFLLMDLFNGRLCNALHAFPMRREGWLTTHILSGLLFSLLPNLLFTLISSLMLWEYAYLSLIWLAVASLQYLFFFGTAVLAAVCAGNLLGTAAIYGITHFVTIFLYVVLQLLYQPLLHGIRIDLEQLERFFPLGQLDNFNYANIRVYFSNKDYLVLEGMDGQGLLYAGICAGAGVLFFALAYLVYRRRDLESAGDFISLKPIAPVFLLICTVGAGAFLYAFSDLVGNASYLFLAVGMLVGYFAGSMLLNRTLKVFGKRSLLTLLVILALFGTSLLLTKLDPLGIVSYIPKAESVEKAYLIGADKGYTTYDTSLTYRQTKLESTYEITDPSELAALQDYHRQLIDYRPDDDSKILCAVNVHYQLKSGRTVTRHYQVERESALGETAGTYFSDMRYIFDVNDTKTLYNAFDSVGINVYTEDGYKDIKLVEEQEIAGLLDAIAKDCENGTMAQNWAYHQENGKGVDYDLEFLYKTTDKKDDHTRGYRHVQIYYDSTNTIAYLNEILETE